MTSKLFKVELQDFRLNPNYVIAEDASSAYDKVRAGLAVLDWGTAEGRELKTIELIAEDYGYPACKARLYV